MWNVFPEIRPNPKNKIITFERRRSPFLLSPSLLASCRPSKPLLLPSTIPNTSKMLLFYRFSILYNYLYFLTFKTKKKMWTDSSKIKMKKNKAELHTFDVYWSTRFVKSLSNELDIRVCSHSTKYCVFPR